MAGHSKWANIKHQKARADAKKGKTFTQLSRAIINAARNGSPDPEANFQLRSAINKAKAAGLPNDNIERALAKGAGTLGSDAEQLESLRYEGYGPGGIALLIEALTDNRNRTAADLRTCFSKYGGNLGETGCVSWMFRQKGVVRLEGELSEEALLEASVEGDAETFEWNGEGEEPGAEVYTEASQLESLNQTLQAQGLPVKEAELRWIPDTYVAVSDPDQARSLLKLLEAIEELDDVQNVTANLTIANELVAASVAS
ncbi:MAG: YebC/PmpR family DNA-binding transcriptional regulator [Cyanobacteria bacterium QS_8_64_29]|nr:MAG: YebC/PmpR family DNA-binding transcriptional regulator [Cyanobacteria bacterium QS_8_64_29]